MKARLTPEHQKKFLEGIVREEEIVEVTTLQKILDSLNVSHVDYLSLDTEGNELQILQGVDWNKTSFGLMGVENNWGDPSVENYLRERGYHRIKKIGVDDFFAKPL